MELPASYTSTSTTPSYGEIPCEPPRDRIRSRHVLRSKLDKVRCHGKSSM